MEGLGSKSPKDSSQGMLHGKCHLTPDSWANTSISLITNIIQENNYRVGDVRAGSPTGFKGTTVPCLHTDSRLVTQGNYKMVHFCHLKLLSLWWFVFRSLGKQMEMGSHWGIGVCERWTHNWCEWVGGGASSGSHRDPSCRYEWLWLQWRQGEEDGSWVNAGNWAGGICSWARLGGRTKKEGCKDAWIFEASHLPYLCVISLRNIHSAVDILPHQFHAIISLNNLSCLLTLIVL